MENNVRIIKLGPVDSSNEAYSFEDAFGEYSEARGRGRERRKKRKLERIKNRDEVRSARQGARIGRRAERKTQRQVVRGGQQEARLSRRERRLQMRQQRQEARQERKGTRSMGKQDRENYAAEQEFYRDNIGQQVEQDGVGQSGDIQDQQSGGFQDQQSEDIQDQQSGGFQDQQDQGVYDANYGSAESAYDYGNQEQPTSDELADEQNDYVDESDYSDESDYLGEYDSEMAFDGINSTDDVTEFTDGNINPKVQDTVNKLVWNEELISRLKNKRNEVGGDQKQQLSKKIIERNKRVNELKSQLDGYCNVEGDFYGADGKVVSNKRKNEIKRARVLALKSRKRALKPIVTPVDSELNPKIGKNTIVIPASSGFTGLNGLDLQNDYNAPEAREFMLSADGSKSSKISWTSVAIGVLVGAASIWAIKKYKLLK